MTDVVIAGIGQTKVGELWDIGLRDLAFDAIQDAVKDFGRTKTTSLVRRQHARAESFQSGASRRADCGLRGPDWNRSYDP